MVTPKDYVAVGQSYELAFDPGSLFTITEVKRTYNRVDGELWYVTLMCVVPPGYAWHPGGTSVEASRDGTLRTTPYRRIG